MERLKVKVSTSDQMEFQSKFIILLMGKDTGNNKTWMASISETFNWNKDHKQLFYGENRPKTEVLYKERLLSTARRVPVFEARRVVVPEVRKVVDVISPPPAVVVGMNN